MTKKEKKKKAMEREYTWRARYPERYKARMRKHYLANREKMIARAIKWREQNKDKYKSNQAAWRKRVSTKRCFEAVKRRAVSRKATPAWANQFFISEAYDLARLRTKMLGYKWHVDHIIPLKSKIVCGLHVENNLRVISEKLNLSKGNRTWPDMPRTPVERAGTEWIG